MNPHITKALGALAVAIVIATGGAAWTASATNGAQEVRIAANEAALQDLRKDQRELLNELAKMNANLAVLVERLRNIERELSNEPRY